MNYKLRITKIIFLVIFYFVIYHSSFVISPLFAQEASPSASPEASDSGVLSKLEGLKKEIASKAADLKAEIDKKIGNKVYSGKISGISIDRITVEAMAGSRSVKVDEFTVYQDQTSQKSKKALTLESLKNDDTIIALGEVDEKSLLTAKKVIKVDPFKDRSFTYVMGQISNIEPQKITLKTKSGVEQTIGLGRTTRIKDDNQAGTIESLTVTRNVIAVLRDKEASQSAFIYLLPTGGLKTLGESSPSAEKAVPEDEED